ncbi:MAG: hypothetical protein K2X87_04315 [Gemmataceae bacterium]|nr:hypothetical protein [Gemmataceae bacterium]
MNGSPWRVVWLRSVREHRVGEIVLELHGRGESTEPVFEAMGRIDAQLSTNPDRRGESRPDGQRILIDRPLAVTFEVHADDRLVVVVRAHYTG